MICAICGRTYTKPMYEDNGKDICSDKCFHKHFWDEVKDEYLNGKKYIIINGTCYYAPIPYRYKTREDKLDTYGFVGFGGRMFHIRMFDGEKFYTNNLWERGTVPKEYKDVLCDNAEFI